MKKIILATMAVAVLTGCSAYSLVNSDVYNGADLAAIRTFRIVTPDDGSMPPGMTAVTYYNIAAAIREQLVERGYRECPSSAVLVNIGVTVKKEIAYQAVAAPGVWVTAPAPPPPPPGPVYGGMVPYFMYPRSYYMPGPTQIVPSVYREGVLTMDVVDTATMTPLYSSSVATVLDAGDTQFRDLQGIAQAVKVLFSKYPVAVLPQYK